MKKPNRLKLARLHQGRKTSFWNRLTGRKHHRLSASVTGESDWEVEVPQIRMSRAFAVMLVLHVIAVGGLFAYRIWGRDEEPKSGAETAPAITAAEPEQAPAITPEPQLITAPQAPAAPEPATEAKTYIWRAGDSIQLIAARFGVATSALREANPDKPLVPGAVLVLPRSGRVFGGSETPGDTARPTPVFDPAHQVAEVAPPAAPRRAQEVPELPAQSEIPDVIPSPEDESGIKVQPVVAHAVVKDQASKPAAAAKKPVSDKTTVSLTPPPPAGTLAKTAPKPSTVIAKQPPAPTKSPARTAGQRVHVVIKGDNVYNLAKRFGFTAEEIARANGLGTDFRINPGQQLKIPVKR